MLTTVASKQTLIFNEQICNSYPEKDGPKSNRQKKYVPNSVYRNHPKRSKLLNLTATNEYVIYDNHEIKT